MHSERVLAASTSCRQASPASSASRHHLQACLPAPHYPHFPVLHARLKTANAATCMYGDPTLRYPSLTDSKTTRLRTRKL
ncbi:hypothetical protein M011DRAFT_465184 [Sporormia fimetaria CBS 119925]|uniref:Uncharacterized protein n=1 Tax=Sporormia fimetaria CBS 119925 TaxID=1340428 RepID=A0A6A6VLK0_9PLEO|nr:hypothetical protein M011DRAFT_465184 [Sporormia fimetaria CBS 119925]